MAENKTDIYGLVNEVNKNKKKTSMEKEKDMNDIFSMLEDIKDDNNISVDEVRNAVNNYSSYNISDTVGNNTAQVRKVSVPNSVENWNSYSDCILAYFKAVDYGTDNSREYVEGHKAALEKYYKEVMNNRNDIYVVEGHVNDEINSMESKTSLRDKGYYDGLFYVFNSLKKAKAQVETTLTAVLKKKLS